MAFMLSFVISKQLEKFSVFICEIIPYFHKII